MQRPIIINMATQQAASTRFWQLTGAVSRYLSARLRGAGLRTVHPLWEQRAELCEQCHLRVIRCGVSYCGNPLLQQIDRDPATEGCGCPCRDKAKSPGEHCPIDLHHHPARHAREGCTCKWCRKVGQLPSE